MDTNDEISEILEEFQSFPILSLPDHVLVGIFKFLEAKDLLKVYLVCRKFHELITRQTDFMKNIKISWGKYNNKPKIQDLDDFVFTLSRSKIAYQVLEIREKFFSSHLLVISQHEHTLRHLRIIESNHFKELRSSEFAVLLNSLTCLEEFEMEGIKLTGTITEKVYAKHLKKMDLIKLKMDFGIFEDNLPNLRSITIYREHTDDSNFWKFLDNQPVLKQLAMTTKFHIPAANVRDNYVEEINFEYNNVDPKVLSIAQRIYRAQHVKMTMKWCQLKLQILLEDITGAYNEFLLTMQQISRDLAVYEN